MTHARTIDDVWRRIRQHAGAEFFTRTGLPFTYSVPGNFLVIDRSGHEVNRSLSRTNFAKALADVPTDGPGGLKGRQGASYTWAILMDPRVRLTDW